MGASTIVIDRSSSHKSCLIWKNELRNNEGGSGIQSVSKSKDQNSGCGERSGQWPKHYIGTTLRIVV